MERFRRKPLVRLGQRESQILGSAIVEERSRGGNRESFSPTGIIFAVFRNLLSSFLGN